MKNKAIIFLAGCGIFDGSDPFETVLSASSLVEKNFEVIYASITGYQNSATNHLSGNLEKGRRKIANESARLSRGKIFLLEDLSPKLCDCFVIPGGQGVLKNFFTDFISLKSKPKKEIALFLRQVHQNKGVIVSFSLSVLLLSSIFTEYNFNFDLLSLQPGKYFVNPAERFIVAPGSILSENLSTLKIEVDNVTNEILNLLNT